MPNQSDTPSPARALEPMTIMEMVSYKGSAYVCASKAITLQHEAELKFREAHQALADAAQMTEAARLLAKVCSEVLGDV